MKTIKGKILKQCVNSVNHVDLFDTIDETYSSVRGLMDVLEDNGYVVNDHELVISLTHPVSEIEVEFINSKDYTLHSQSGVKMFVGFWSDMEQAYKVLQAVSEI